MSENTNSLYVQYSDNLLQLTKILKERLEPQGVYLTALKDFTLPNKFEAKTWPGVKVSVDLYVHSLPKSSSNPLLPDDEPEVEMTTSAGSGVNSSENLS